MEAVLYSIVGFVACALLGGIWTLIKKKYKIKDVDADCIKDIQKKYDVQREQCMKRFDTINAEYNTLSEAFPVVLSSLYAVLITLERGNSNGEIIQAKAGFTEAFKQKFYIKIKEGEN